jgi:hypothetical protein
MLSTDLKVYKAKANGRMDGSQLVTSGALQNVFPHVTSAQRAAGFFDYKKTFWKIADDSDGTAIDPEIYLDAPTLSLTDYVLMFAMGQRDRVEDLTGYSTGADTQTKYGSAVLKNSITAGASSLTVTVRNAALASGNDAIFRNGGKIKLTDKATADALTGNEEVLTISGAPVVSGLDITITVLGTIANSYTANGTTRASSLIKPGDITTSVTAPVKTSTAGTIDFTTYPITLDHIGTVDEDWTLTRAGGAWTLSGDSLGVIGTGIALTAANYAPSNTDFTKPFMTIDYRALSGTWADGDTITFTTHPAAVGIGQKRVVPAGTASLSNNRATQVLACEAV